MSNLSRVGIKSYDRLSVIMIWRKANGRGARIIWLAVACMLIGTGIWLVRRDPHYQGKSLSQWSDKLEEVPLRVTDRNGVELDSTNAAMQAFITIGSNAVPWLRKELRSKDSKLTRLVYSLPSSLRIPVVELFVHKVHLVRAPDTRIRHLKAGMAAMVLGGKASSLAPEIGQLLSSEEGDPVYAFALARMGENGLPGLIQGLSRKDSQFETLWALEWVKADVTPALPVLLALFANGDS